MGSRYRDKEDDGGRKPKKKSNPAVTVLTTILLIAAIGVFAFSAWKLLGYYREYQAGTDEYNKLKDTYVEENAGEEITIDDPALAQSGAEDEALIGETETEIVTQEDGTVTVARYRKGKLLTSVEELEDADTLDETLEKAAARETEENGKKQMLPMLINPVDFEELEAVNEEIIGWIRIGALDLSYPVAQSSDNDYYLHRTFERQDNFAGCIFLNCSNSRYFTDQNTIIYGHNMKNGSMFGTLKNLQDQELYDKNPFFWIYTKQFIYQYRIFSCAVVSKEGDNYRTRFTTDEFTDFLAARQSDSLVDNHGLQVSADDRIVTLSTCTGDDSTRFIVQGVLKQVYLAK